MPQSQLKKELVEAIKTLLSDNNLDTNRLSVITQKLKDANIPKQDYEKVLIYVLMINTVMPEVFTSMKSDALKKLVSKCSQKIVNEPSSDIPSKGVKPESQR